MDAISSRRQSRQKKKNPVRPRPGITAAKGPWSARSLRRLRRLGSIVLVLLLMIFMINNFIETYRWENPLIEEMEKQGFEVVSQTKGSAPILPWTLFYPYVAHVTLVHPDSIKRYKGFLAADVISFNKDERDKVESWPRIVLFDCASNLVANLADQRGRYEDRIFRPDGAQVKQQWFEMNEQMNAYFCKNIFITR
jgi:hypothetical protein